VVLMKNRLKRETRNLQKSWMQYDATLLRDYLIEEAEDPRVNIQSILTRHFLIEGLFGNRFAALKQEELRFAIAMNWLLKLFEKSLCADDAEALLYALSKRADNAAGVEIPHYVSKIYAALPARADGLIIPNYIKEALREAQSDSLGPALTEQRIAIFQSLWRKALARRRPPRLSVLEPACGSANDYRFIEAFGLGRLMDYTGFDLCEKNISNARSLFPKAHFKMGNAFEIDSPNRAFDFCFVHDLFEHLSIEGMEAAIAEICRVTRKGICASFFNMAELDEHMVRPVDDYHWNTLSMERTREVFCRKASSVQVLHIGTWLQWSFNCPQTYNEKAYTFVVTM
jgi:SAM-dependent methyltransferase